MLLVLLLLLLLLPLPPLHIPSFKSERDRFEGLLRALLSHCAHAVPA